MKLYESIIKNTIDLLSSYTPISFAVSQKLAWNIGQTNELILKKDSEFELGGSYKPAVNYQCVTTSDNLIEKDEILLYGEDLTEIKNDVSFARLAFLQINNLGDDEKAYKVIKELEFIKYNMNLKGYMMRASTMDKREQVRVAKSAVVDGISFENIGNSFINKYKQNSLVKAVRIIFITSDMPIFKQLMENARKIDEITLTLNHVLNNMNFDCSSCNLKPICDEVEGMRELHFKSGKR
jgi:CO dehydrogenase/acetyl-CoA synthase beta subunit